MSRVGNKSIPLPEKVSVKNDGGAISIEGPKGTLSWTLPKGISLEEKDGEVYVSRESDHRQVRALHGTSRSLVANMITGVSDGFVRELEILGVGFRAALNGAFLDLSLGFSHPVNHPVPAGITVTVTESTSIKIEGIDKHAVGQFASDVRSYYPPEPYKGKGVRYKGEQVRRKAGKSVK